METPASPTNGEITCTILRYSAISSGPESLRPEARASLRRGFFEINDGFVVCPSRKPINSFTRRVSSGSPPSSNIFVLTRLIDLLLQRAVEVVRNFGGVPLLCCCYVFPERKPHQNNAISDRKF